MNQQGQIAFPGLNNVTWLAANFQLFQQYIQAFNQEIISDLRTTGVLFGGQVTVVAGLQVKIAAGAVLFSNGKLVAWADQNVTLDAADPSNPRIDRLELAYSLVNNSSINDNETPPVPQTLDQLFVASGFKNKGTPAGSPAAPATTSGNVSIALITVGAGAVALSGGNINQTEDTAFTPSALVLGDSSHLMRLNRTSGVFEFTYDGGATWNALGASGKPKQITHADSPYTVTRANPKLEVDTSGGNVIVNLPALTSAFPVDITKTTADANTVTATPNGGDTINGDASDSLAVQYANKNYKPTSVAWVI